MRHIHAHYLDEKGHQAKPYIKYYLSNHLHFDRRASFFPKVSTPSQFFYSLFVRISKKKMQNIQITQLSPFLQHLRPSIFLHFFIKKDIKQRKVNAQISEIMSIPMNSQLIRMNKDEIIRNISKKNQELLTQLEIWKSKYYMMQKAYQQLLNARNSEKQIKQSSDNVFRPQQTIISQNFFASRTTTSPQKKQQITTSKKGSAILNYFHFIHSIDRQRNQWANLFSQKQQIEPRSSYIFIFINYPQFNSLIQLSLNPQEVAFIKIKMDDYEVYEKRITDAINKYKKSRDKQIYRKINHELDMYLLFLDENFADQEKYDWHASHKKLLNTLKQEKQLIGGISPQIVQGERAPLSLDVGKEVTQQLQKEIDDALKNVEKGVEKAIEVSNFIKIQLDKQIAQLDDVYEENRNFQARMKRVKNGLTVILRQAMTNKITRFFAMLLVVAIIGVIIVLILRSNGTIA